MSGRFSRVINDHLPEVVIGAQDIRGEHPHLDEVREVTELIEGSGFLNRGERQHLAVPPGDVQERLRPNRSLEVHV